MLFIANQPTNQLTNDTLSNIMFRKLRIRSNRSSQEHLATKPNGKKGGAARSIFRKKTNDQQPPHSIEPALTFTLSEDEETGHESCVGGEVLTPDSPKIQQISSYIFTEEQLMKNELHHMRALAEKQAEIIKLQTVHKELLQALEEKSRELVEMKEEVEMKDKELVETYQELTDMDDELHTVKEDLNDTKNKLKDVSTVLMRLQGTMHHTEQSYFRFW